MGDRLVTIYIGRYVGAAVPPSVGKLRPRLRQCAWVEVYLRTKWHLDPSNRLATTHQRYRQTGQRSRSIGRTVTCNGRPITEIVVMDFHEIWLRGKLWTRERVDLILKAID